MEESFFDVVDLEQIDTFVASIPQEFDFNFQTILSPGDIAETANLPQDELSTELPLQFQSLLIYVISRSLTNDRRTQLYDRLRDRCLNLEKLTEASVSWDAELIREVFRGYHAHARYPAMRNLLQKFVAATSEKDDFTGLKRRTSLLIYLGRELLRHKAFGTVFCVLIVDIDHLIEINNYYGIDSGDEVILATSRSLRDSLRPLDLAFRTSGDEFTAILVHTAIKEAIVSAEAVRRAVSELFLHRFKDSVPLSASVSIGISEVQGGSETSETVLARADRALWGAKRNRGNCVETAEI